MSKQISQNRPRIYIEKIGDREWSLEEATLHIYDDVTLWSSNPRLQTELTVGDIHSEAQLEVALQGTTGYEVLRKSISELGQMEPIYVLPPSEAGSKRLILEGATRVTILRELDRRHPSGPKEGRYRYVKAKVLPNDFGERERTILLARIHVRGSGVRAWGRYVEAKFIYEAVSDQGGPALMNSTQMANYMEKSVSWVTRLRDAYRFALAYVEHTDDEEGTITAAKSFSILEEICKARVIGSQLKEYNNPEHDELRADVFDMVTAKAFKEYRDARFLKEFHDDPDKWEQLKSGEENVASRLALELKTNGNSIRSRIGALPQQVRRSIERNEDNLGDEEIDALLSVAGEIENHINPGVRPFRMQMRKFTNALAEVNMNDVKALPYEDVTEFRDALNYFDQLFQRFGPKAGNDVS